MELRYRASLPMTMPSSTSQSVFTLFLGIKILSYGPMTVLAALRNTMGSVGIAMPDSLAWSE